MLKLTRVGQFQQVAGVEAGVVGLVVELGELAVEPGGDVGPEGGVAARLYGHQELHGFLQRRLDVEDGVDGGGEQADGIGQPVLGLLQRILTPLQAHHLRVIEVDRRLRPDLVDPLLQREPDLEDGDLRAFEVGAERRREQRVYRKSPHIRVSVENVHQPFIQAVGVAPAVMRSCFP